MSVAFSSAVDDSTDGHDEVNTLRASIKEKDQCLSALEALRKWREVVKDGLSPNSCTTDLVAFLQR